jgi:peptidyl-prolyl cis-trans isomerase SurA
MIVPPSKVASFACLLVCLTGTAFAQLQKSVADKIVAVVGDEIILRSDIQDWLADIRREGSPVTDSTECTVVKSIVHSKILLLQAFKDSITVSDEEVENELNMRINNEFNLAPDKRKAIFARIKEYRLTNLMQEKILDKVKITPTEVKNFYQSIPPDQLPSLNAQYEVGQIVAYPKPTAEMENYLLAEMNRYKQRVESKQITFQKLAISVSEAKDIKENEGLYQVNRNMKGVDPQILSTTFRLKEGEISTPIKIKGGYCLVQLIGIDGDDASVVLILRGTPIAEKEIKETLFNLNTVRAEIKLGETSFEQAAKEHSEAKQAAFSAFMQNRNGESFVTLDELPTDLAKEVFNLKAGEISEAKTFIDEEGKKGVRIVFLKSKAEAHRMNLTNDYSRITQLALDNKKLSVLAAWFKARIPDFQITIEEEILSKCSDLREYNN